MKDKLRLQNTQHNNAKRISFSIEIKLCKEVSGSNSGTNKCAPMEDVEFLLRNMVLDVNYVN